MAEQLRDSFEKFVDWRQCAVVMLLWRSRHYYVTLTTTTWHSSHGPPLHNSGALPPVHALFKWLLYISYC